MWRKKNIKVGLALGSGSARGWAHIGAIEAIEEAGIPIHYVAGTSIGAFVGAAIIGSSNKGFSGLVKIMVGFKPNGDIQNMVVLEQKETPGLGTKMKDEKFLRQFRDKNPSSFDLKVKKDGGEVDALTGATISTRAFTEAVQIAFDEFMKNRKSITKSDN